MGDFDGLVAVVTGGASGIGEATASLLVERGARVAVLDLDVDGVASDRLGVACDVSDSRSVRNAVGTVVAHLSGIDVVVNNAGVGAEGDVSANDEDEWHHVLDVNVVGMARVASACLPYLRESRSPAIVNTCSVVALVGFPNRALYSASKGAVAALTLAMAADHLKEGIRINAVAPGTADTPWVSRLLGRADDPEAMAAALKARQPMGRLVTAEEIAHTIAHLASPLSSATTGTIVPVDGGLTGTKLA